MYESQNIMENYPQPISLNNLTNAFNITTGQISCGFMITLSKSLGLTPLQTLNKTLFNNETTVGIAKSLKCELFTAPQFTHCSLT